MTGPCAVTRLAVMDRHPLILVTFCWRRPRAPAFHTETGRPGGAAVKSLLARATILLGREAHSAVLLSGGDLSTVLRLDLVDGSRIICKSAPLVALEADMLAALAARQVPVPRVIACEGDILLMEELVSHSARARPWAALAEVLDQLHRPSQDIFGWRSDYGFGPVAIPNAPMGDWVAFWRERRLLVHLPHVDARLAARLEELAGRLGDLIPAAPPSALLHGDLWGGNILSSGGEISGLIDPACYHGDREVDFAMLGLFDAVPAAFFDACSLDPGWEARQPVYRLWPLLVHLRLFGDSYAGQVRACLDQLGA